MKATFIFNDWPYLTLEPENENERMFLALSHGHYFFINYFPGPPDNFANLDPCAPKFIGPPQIPPERK